MDTLCCFTKNSQNFLLQLSSFSNSTRNFTHNFSVRKPRNLAIFCSKDGPKLSWEDQMELKFGRMIGEDPKLTLAKIMGRKANPDMTFLEIEKLYYRKGKVVEIEELPFEGAERVKSTNATDASNGLNLVRPVPKEGVKFETNDKPPLSNLKRPNQTVAKAVDSPRRSIPNVVLRRPTTFNEEDDKPGKSTKLRIKPNLSFKIGQEQDTERFTDMTLVRKPEPFLMKDKESAREVKEEAGVFEEHGKELVSVASGPSSVASLLQKPEMNLNLSSEGETATPKDSSGSADDCDANNSLSTETVNETGMRIDSFPEDGNVSSFQDHGLEHDFLTELQPSSQSDMLLGDGSIAINSPADGTLSETNFNSKDSALLGKPERLYQSVKGIVNTSEEATPERDGIAAEHENLIARLPLKESEDVDWTRAEAIMKSGARVEVEVISSSTRGFVVTFGSLIGFLPYRNLPTKWKYLAFESWLRRNGLDPSRYRQSLGIIGSNEAEIRISSPDPGVNPQIKVEGAISPDMKLEELLSVYDQQKLKYLSSFVGQKVKVNVVLADKESRRLIFSVKPKEKEELIENKRKLMAKLSVGDIVKCCIKKITYFGIFVEIEGVPALIHQTEVSWDATLDPSLYYKIGQIVEAKVHQIDFSLERIFLSLKEITPDPLNEALEAVVGDNASLDGILVAVQPEEEWADVELLVKELQQYEGIQSVSKGQFFLSPGLAPTFQVYMASMYEDQYKLLARSGNKVQEVIVQTSLGKEEMKSAISTCTNRVV